MTMRPISVCRVSLAACATIGIGLILAAVLLVPVLPHVQLDVVLTPRELADPQTRQTTLALLKKASGNQWLLWLGAGLAVTMSAGIGLVACRRAALPAGGADHAGA
jgi:hypothetical protein